MTRSSWVPSIGMVFVLTACGQNEASVVNDSLGGASYGSGGITGAGGASLSGGSSSRSSSAATTTGGSSSVGGTTSTQSSQGGTSTGGSKPIGGTANTTTTPVGGKTATGGTTSTATGGTRASGGSSSTNVATGTSSSTATGGSSTAGTASTGGGATVGGASTGGAATGGSGIGGQTTTPASATSKFPFPQNRRDTKCIYPTRADYGDVKKAYDQWKKDLVTSDGVGSNCNSCQRVKRPAEHNLQKDSTVSEGIAYGMIIAVYMDDQTLFDGLWRYEQAHTAMVGSMSTNPSSLMNWYIFANGNTGDGSNGEPDGHGAATDADEDMAWALVMADKQWGGKGGLGDTYSNYAKKLLSDIWTYEIDNYKTPKNGSGWGGDNCLNISYFAPSHYRAFAPFDGRWTSNVVPNVYSIIAASLNSSNGNQDNGLVPAFSTSTGGNDQCATGGGSNQKHWYQYDSCRTPFRIGVDACLNDSSDAKNYVAKTTSFFAPKGVAGIVDGYELNGKDKPEFPGGTYNGLSAAFIGPAGVGAMAPQSGKDYQSFVDDVYDHLRDEKMWTGGQYYDESWTVMSLLMMTGNYLDYTKY